jgi:hypothetical protein
MDLARTLRELGIWRDLSAPEVSEAEQAVANGGYPFRSHKADQGVRRFSVDGETMAEGGVIYVLKDMIPALRVHGVELQLENVNLPRVGDTEGEYVVAINGHRCIVWTPEEKTTDRDWETATVRPLAVINGLLSEADATDRLFTVMAGTNDGVAWLIDPSIVAAVADSGLCEESDLPALAVRI